MSGATLGVDWLDFTVPYEKGEAVVNLLPGPLVMRCGGWRGYTHSAWVVGGAGRAGWSPDDPGRGLHLSLPARCLDALASLDPWFSDASGLIGLVQDGLDGHVTRLDLCWDDREGLLDMEVMRQALRSGACTSRWRGGLEVEGWGDQRGSRTLYLGSRASDTRLRIYDKAAEQSVEGQWVRIELVARRKRADSLAAEYKLLREDTGRTHAKMAGILRGYLDFKVPGQHTDRSRWPTADWWLQFLGRVEKSRVGSRQSVRTISDIERWIEKQVVPSLVVLEAVQGEAAMWGWLHDRVEAARPRLGPRHRTIIAASITERRERGSE